MDFTKKIIPFAITFTIGIFVASFFYSLTGSNSDFESYSNTFGKKTKHQRTHCGFERRVKRDFDILDLVPPVPISPAPAPIAPEVKLIYIKKTSPKTIVLRKDLGKKNK
ncbi:MAG: hypothetical protein ACR2J3_12520 [Aridibacter sp.]